ncbi:hypothetical protein ACLB2K_004871 [Fragaria x ananassa]
MAEYDGLHDVAAVWIVSFPIWVEIMGLPPHLFTDEATEKLGLTLASEVQVDKLGVKCGICNRVRALHRLCDPILEAFQNVPFEFESQRFPVNLQFNKVSNPFAISGVSTKVGIPSLSFSLPGVSVAKLAAQLARF